MRLESIKVCGLFYSHDVEIRFCEGGLTFVHALNGMGKSTVLRMIVDIFSYNAGSLSSAPFESVEILTEDGHRISVRNSDGITAEFDGKSTEFADLSKMLKVVYLNTDRLFVERLGVILPAQVMYFEEIHPKYMTARRDNVPHMKEEVMDNGLSDDQIISKCRDLKARLDFIAEEGMEMKIPEGINFPPNRCDLIEERMKYLSFLEAANEWADKYYEFAESISAFIDILNSFYQGKKVVLGDDLLFRVILNNGHELSPKQMSAGERQVLVIFFRLLFHCRPGDIAIIDEPEISLHISWQQRMGALFSEISRIRNIQIIVATHSPQIIHDMWDQTAEMRIDRA